MEFLLVPLIIGLALVLLSVGKIFGRENELHSCKGEEEDDCLSCATSDKQEILSPDDPGFKNVAKLGNPNRKNRFIDKLDFRPERFK